MATNYVTYFTDSALRAAREAEVPNASFVNGMNPAASNAPAVGVNTGDYGPKPSDWPHMDERIQESQYIGEAQSGINVDDPVFGPTSIACWAQTTAEVAPDGIIDVDVAGSGFSSINRTGKTIPADEWTWGVADNP